MKRFNRYLLFYLILGIGLAIAWTQVGRRARLAPNTGLRVMGVDEHCRPQSRPCAAYAHAFALVLGPNAGQPGLLLKGEKLPADARLDLVQLDVHALALDKPLLKPLPGGRWLIGPVHRSGRLRINVSAGQSQWIAEFPLEYPEAPQSP
jgi:hypothetical protein